MVEGYRLTNQRAIILDYLKDNRDHPSVDEIYNYVKTKLPRISKKTVYSNLTFLSEKGLISEVNLKGVLRYEPKMKPHHHILCARCGKVMDFESDKLVEYSMKIAEQIKEFDIDSAATNFYGTCESCKVKNGKI